jgi:WD40-like Beta Propeller Repeat
LPRAAIFSSLYDCALPVSRNVRFRGELLQGKSWPALALLVCAAAILPACNDYIVYPAPRVQDLNPSSIQAGQPLFNLVVTGFQFTPASVVQWNGTSLITLFQTVNQITAQVPATLITSPGSVSVEVFTPSPGGGTSSVLIFTITPQTTPVPQITSISPSGILAGSAAFDLFITGSNFLATSTITVDGDNRTMTFVNPTSIETQIQASDVVNAGTVQIVVINPAGPASAPGGGASSPVSLIVKNPVPTVTSLSPANFSAGTTTNTIVTIAGTNMVPSSEVEIDGGAPAAGTTFSNSTQITTTLNPGNFTSAGVHTLEVVNPAPGGGSSNIVTFAVNPTLTAGLPELLDVAYEGAQANAGICGSNCAVGPPTLTTAGPGISSNGSTVIFASTSTNLLFDQANSGSDIFTRTTCLGNSSCTPATTDVSVGPNKIVANGASSEPSIDGSGAHAAFTSTATNLVAGISFAPTNRQVYWMPVCTGSSTACAGGQLVSLSPDGVTPGNGDSYNPSISPDGRYVAFASLATNLVAGVNTFDGITPQVFLRDTCTGSTASGCTPTTYLISTPDGVTPGNGASSQPSVSNDATYVSFTSSASNLGSTAPNPNGAQEVFVRTVCLPTLTSVSIVTTCAPFNTLVSTPDGVTPANGVSSESKVASAGRFVTFASTATNLIAGVGPTQQVYMYDTCLTGTVITTGCAPAVYLVSTGDGTTPGNAVSETPSISQASTTLTASSTAGEFIAFASRASNLGFNTQNGIENIFVRELCVGFSSTITICTPSTTLASQGSTNPNQPNAPAPQQSNGDSLMPAISSDSHTVAFISSANNLVVPGTTNDFANLFLGLTSF